MYSTLLPLLLIGRYHACHPHSRYFFESDSLIEKPMSENNQLSITGTLIHHVGRLSTTNRGLRDLDAMLYAF
jgi:hypothetical protein